MHASKKVLTKQVFGFAVTGTITTVLMLVIYVGLHQLIGYQYAYLVSYAISVLALYFMNVRFVFHKRPSLNTFLKFPLIYIVQYLCGAIFLEFIVRLGVSVTFAPVVVVIILLPVTFVLNRLVLW